MYSCPRSGALLAVDYSTDDLTYSPGQDFRKMVSCRVGHLRVGVRRRGVDVGRFDMSQRNMSWLVLGVGMVVLLCSVKAAAQEGEFFEGCGVLGITHPEECLAFFPDGAKSWYSIGELSDGEPWGGYGKGDRIFVSGMVQACASFCVSACFSKGSTIEACADVPAVSQWGIVTLALLLVTAATIVIRNRKRYRDPTGVYACLLVCALSAPSMGRVRPDIGRMDGVPSGKT